MNINKITVALFTALENLGIKYCVYNGYEKLPRIVESDIDIAIEEKGLYQLDSIIFELSRRNNLLMVHKIWHDKKNFAYVLSPFRLAKTDRLQLDFFSEFSIHDPRKSALERFLILGENDLLLGRRRFQYFFVPSIPKEFLVKIIRRIFKDDLSYERFKRLVFLYNNNKDGCKQEIRKYFPDQTDLIVNAFENKDFVKLRTNLYLLKKTLRRFRKNPFVLQNLINLFKRGFYRIKHPVGISVAFLGPDGCGKSTVIKEVRQILSRSFPGQDLFYWRPTFLKQPGVVLGLRNGVKTDTNLFPHAHHAEHPIKSFLRFCYYLFDFTVGYLVKVYPLTIANHLCVFDRYYYDVLVDSFRYNFSLPRWLLKLPLLIVPKPTLIIILDVPVGELINRKQELPEVELKRQRHEFLKLASQIPNVYIIDNSRSIREVIKEIASIILLTKSYRTHFSLNLKNISYNAEEYFRSFKNLFGIKKVNSNYSQRIIAFPDDKSPRVFYPAENLKCFKTSLSLYTPSRLGVKFLYNNIPPSFLFSFLKIDKRRQYYLTQSPLLEKIKELFPMSSTLSISTGAPGPHRKPLVQVLDKDGEALGYLKISMNDSTNDLLRQEADALEFIRSLELQTAQIPEIIDNGTMEGGVKYIALKSTTSRFKKSYRFTYSHMDFIRELFEKTGKEENFGKSQLFKELNNRVNFLRDKIPYYWTLSYKKILDRYKETVLPVYLSHGDFTPWNVFLTYSGQLLIFDWEYSRYDIFLADFFHFIINRALFSSHNDVVIKSVLRDLKSIEVFSTSVQKYLLNSWFLLFLLEESSFYLFRNSSTNYIEKDLRIEKIWFNLLNTLFQIS